VGIGYPTPRVPFYLSPILYGVLAALMVIAMGNLAAPFAKKDAPNTNGNGWRFCFFCEKQGYGYWWDPSRIILDYRTVQQPDGTLLKTPVEPETINEFPAFSFVLADMHPHLMGLPFVLLAVTIAYALARRKVARSNRWRDGVPRSLGGWLTLLVASIVVGALYTINTWDYPTYLLVMLGGLALPYIAAGHREEGGGWRWARPFIVYAALLVVLSLLAYLPFHLTFTSFAGGGPVALPENVANIPVLGGLLQRLSGLFLLNTADKTITGFIVIFGIFLLALTVWLIYEFATYMRKRARTSEEGVNTLLIFGIVLMAILLIAVWTRFPLLALLLPLIIMAGYLVWQEPRRTERNLALGVFLIAASIGLGVEIIYLHDNFGNRMNTLFKFYYQMWVLWSLVGAYGFWRTLQAAFGRNRTVSVGRGYDRVEVAVNDTPNGVKVLAGTWAAAFLLLVLASLTYVWVGSQQRNVLGKTALLGLDGLEAMRATNPSDYEAIKWLNQHAGPRDVVLECCRNEYDWPGRISAFTGLPTLVAWDTSHEKLWRSSQPALSAEVDRRRQVVNAVYQGTDPDDPSARLTPQKLLDTLNTYGVDYVVVGAIERGTVGPRTREIGADERITPYGENVMKVALPEVFRSSDGTTVVYGVQGAKVDPNVVVPTPLPAQTPGQEGQQPDPNVGPVGLFDRTGPGPNRGQFNLPRDIAIDAGGSFYVSDTENKRIQKFDATGKWLLSFGSEGNGNGQFAAISPESVGTGPGGLAVDAGGNLYVADTWNHRIQKFDSEGRFVASWGSFINLADPAFADAPDKDSRFYGPRGVAIGPDGNVYVTDTGNKRVLVFTTDGAFVRKIDSGMSPTRVVPGYAFNQPGELNEPIGIAVDAQGNVYVADVNNHRIQKFDTAGKPVAQWPVPGASWDPGPYLEPFLALDGGGNLYAAAPSSKSVLKFDANGQVAATKNANGGVTLSLPTGLTVGADGSVYVVDTTNNSVVNLGTIP
jgi:YYY domain-containing protein